MGTGKRMPGRVVGNWRVDVRGPRIQCSRVITKALRWICVVLAMAMVNLTGTAWGQESDFTEALSGKVHPLSMKLKDFSAEWRRITLQSTARMSDNFSVNVSGNTSGSTSQNNIMGALTGSRTYLTKGQTMSACGRSYLVAYHLPASALDLGTLIQAMVTKTPPALSLLTPETGLPLALLDLPTIGSLDDVRAFDSESEIEENKRAALALLELFKGQGDGKPTNSPPSKPDPK